jgi:hypothetical protein
MFTKNYYKDIFKSIYIFQKFYIHFKDHSKFTSQKFFENNDNLFEEVWELLNSNHEEYDQIKILYGLMLVFSTDSVICERNFSLMNFIKTENRNRIKETNLNNLMIIKCNLK